MSSKSYEEPKDTNTLHGHDHLTSLSNKSNKPYKNLTKILGILEERAGKSLRRFHLSPLMDFQHGKRN